MLQSGDSADPAETIAEQATAAGAELRDTRSAL